MLALLQRRHANGLNPRRKLASSLNLQLASSLELSQDVELKLSKGLFSMDLDPAERRYLLLGSIDASISIADTSLIARRTSLTPTSDTEKLPIVATTPALSHRFAVSCVQWYPEDTGIFSSSSTDGAVKIWDTNNMRVVEQFAGFQAVHAHDMAVLPDARCLAAVASLDRHVFLCDIRTGARTHALKGHHAAATAVRWSPYDPYVLASGSKDGQIYLWDIRRGKSYLSCFKRTGTTDTHNRAHAGRITAIEFAPCHTVYSLGSDNIMSAWDSVTLKNKDIHFPQLSRKSKRTIRLAIVGSQQQLLMVPDDKEIRMFAADDGRELASLRAHYRQVTCLAYNAMLKELYSASSDPEVMVWQPSMRVQASHDAHTRVVDPQLDVDDWSDEEGAYVADLPEAL